MAQGFRNVNGGIIYLETCNTVYLSYDLAHPTRNICSTSKYFATCLIVTVPIRPSALGLDPGLGLSIAVQLYMTACRSHAHYA